MIRFLLLVHCLLRFVTCEPSLSNIMGFERSKSDNQEKDLISPTLYLDTFDDSLERDLDTSSCGVDNSKIRRIVGGNVTLPNKYPWMVGLLRVPDRLLFCGGTLISKKHVLTAAHCTRGRLARDILVGTRLHNSTLAQRRDANETFVAQVAKISQHRRFKTVSTGFDISVLVLEKEVHLDRYIRPICLPPLERSFTGQSAVVAGWGRIVYDGDISTLLREVALPIISSSDCSKSMKNVLSVRPNMICAGSIEGGKDACQGDSGGPLMWQDTDSGLWHIIGIVSFGVGCAQEGYYGVYTRVNSYTDWLHKVMEGQA